MAEATVEPQPTGRTGGTRGWGHVERWRRTVLLVGVGALLALVALTALVLTTGHMGPWDARIRQWMARPHHTWTSVATALSATAMPAISYPLLAIAGAFTSARTRRWGALVMTTLASALLGFSVYYGKLVVDRPRPRLGTLPAPPVPSYPSGHAATSVVVAGCLLILAGGVLTVRQRRLALTAAVVYAGAVGVSRIVLGVHWTSDVLAGWLLGTVIVTAMAWFFSDPPTATPTASDTATAAGTQARWNQRPRPG